MINKHINGVLLFAGASTRLKVFSMLVLVLLADFLFYNHSLGWTVGFYGCVLVGAFSFHNAMFLKSRMALALILFTLGQCLLLFEKSSLLPLFLMILGVVSLSLLRRDDWKNDAYLWVRLSLWSLLWFMGPLNRVNKGYRRYAIKNSSKNLLQTFIRGWFLPIFLSIIFLYLFAKANPVISEWLKDINFWHLFSGLSIKRIVFWVVMAGFVALVIRPRFKLLFRKNNKDETIRPPEYKGFREWVFTKDSVLRSLVIFNLLFLLQIVMDIDYLWAGGALPEGITYAQYAHKGAYPLIVTALLAALFALITQSSQKEISGSKLISYLMYLWIGQNVLLVLFSIYRTSLYVEIYALTYWRVAAFIWMGLVACGLIWIILRGVYDKSNWWLINANVLMLLAVLYVTSFVNVGGMIAHYNIAHSKEVSGTGTALDVNYLINLGSRSIPALQKYYDENPEQSDVSCRPHRKERPVKCKDRFDTLKKNLKRGINDWRSWTYSEYRLLKSLEKP